jgi:hypothetical protein
MLKNELDMLAAVFDDQPKVFGLADNFNTSGLGELVNQRCNQAREHWSAAAFSDHSYDVLQRYFNFHFSFLNNLIAEKGLSDDADGYRPLFRLMDYLLIHYKHFLDQKQHVSPEYTAYRLRSSQKKYKLFLDQLEIVNSDQELRICLVESLSPIYTCSPIERIELGAMFYREELITELASGRNSTELMTAENLISVLICFNFNHMRFLTYLRKKAMKGIAGIQKNKFPTYFLNLITEIPKVDIKDNRCFDSNWPHISVMYKDWLNDYQILVNLTLQQQSHHQETVNKIPLNISVKHLGCMIRALYESGCYGNISLTAIFEHAAMVYTTKRQEHISAESISNAYYGISLSASLKVSRVFGDATRFLRPYCSPV